MRPLLKQLTPLLKQLTQLLKQPSNTQIPLAVICDSGRAFQGIVAAVRRNDYLDHPEDRILVISVVPVFCVQGTE